MGTPLGLWRQPQLSFRAWIALAVLVAATALPSFAFATPAPPATARADIPAVAAVARLDSDPVPARIIAGEFDDRFVDQPNAVIRETEQSPRWWRVTVGRAMAPDLHPHLVVHTPHLTLVEAWVPGEALTIRRAMIWLPSSRRSVRRRPSMA